MDKKKIEKFEDLFVWQKARELVKSVYGLTSKWNDYGLRDQIQRAAVSVMSNIAEGFERGTKDEFLYFLYIARGSCGEVRAQLYVAADQRYISENEFSKTASVADHVSRLLYKLIDSYKRKSYGGQRYADSGKMGRDEFEKYLKRLVEGGREKVSQ